ncbi:MAG: histidine--tRNA ligase [Patescibacteria group bacterium]
MGRPKKIKQEVKQKIKQKLILPVRGMEDILSQDEKYWDYLLFFSEKYARAFGFKKIETPVLERTELFVRGIGVNSDIVSKEMFSFQDRGGDNLTLRPEWTAGIIRAYIQHGMLNLPQPVKVYSFGPLFRHERPQAGRWRQFHQVNFEVIGNRQPVIDAQIVSCAWKILQKLGLKNIEVQINSIGCGICRPAYVQVFLDFLAKRRLRLCDDCKKRLKKNPLRVLDCKREKCQIILSEAPQIIDHLCDNCHQHFKQVLEYLDEVEIVYNLNPKLVRGLDYYTKTVFEIWQKDDIKGKVALGSGGRYDDLVELLGGKKTYACGIALGVERIIEQIKKQNILMPEKRKADVLFIQLGELAKKKALKHIYDLIENDINVCEIFHKDSIKTQLGIANSLKVKFVVILGQKEVLDGTILIRDMTTGVQEIINIEKLIPELKKRLNHS